MSLKLKIGDKAKIIRCSNGHGFKIGTEVIIDELYPENPQPHYRASSKDECWFVRDSDLSPIETNQINPNMTELKITKEAVLAAAAKCSTAKATLETLFPEVFKFEADRLALYVR